MGPHSTLLTDASLPHNPHTRAQAAGAANKRGGAAGGEYLKISEAEIADDYPPPKQYVAVSGARCEWAAVWGE